MSLIGARRALFRGRAAAPTPGLFAKVGSFAKTTAAATASQAITGVGFRPKALILWTSGGTVDGTIRTQATGDARTCVGIVSGTATADQFAFSTTLDTAGSGGRRVTQKAFLLSDATGATVVSTAVLASFDLDGFTLSWTTNAIGEAQVINYLAIGGEAVQAKVLTVLSPSSTGNFATTGVGFRPNALFLAGVLVNAAALDTAFGLTLQSVGAGVSSSARWAAAASSFQAASSAGFRRHVGNKFVQEVNPSDGTASCDMDLVSLDADGFTLNLISSFGASAVGFGLLCLKVPNVAVGTFAKPTGAAPATGSVSGLGFTPAAVLLASDQDISRSGATSQTGARIGLSAFTATDAAASVWSIPNAPSPLTFAALVKSGKAAVKIDNATPAIDAEATGVIDGAGFSLTWNANDAVATEFGYVALGA